MRVLFDSSAIAKRYKKEAGHSQVQQLLMTAETVVLAAHCKVEIASSLCRELHDSVITQAQYGQALDEIAQDFIDFDVRPVSPEIEALALTAMERNRLRAMDALHIASAQAARIDLFVTADGKQAAAAQAAGLKTQLIEA